MKSGLELIADERQRQIDVKGYSFDHDRIQRQNESIRGKYETLKKAAEAYEKNDINLWPWDRKLFKPTLQDPVRRLTKAGALYKAQYDCLQQFPDDLKILQQECLNGVERVSKEIDYIQSHPF